MSRMNDKVALVTGAARGVGREDVLLLAREGAQVVITDLNVEAGQALALEIGDQALFVQHDIAEETDWDRVIAATVGRFGRLDVLVNNAAILQMGNIASTTLAQWRTMQRVNADGYFLGCRAAVKQMRAGGRGGSIVNMASLASLAGLSEFCAYSASKGAVAALTRSVAVYCKREGLNIRCNSVHPDGIRTPMLAEAFMKNGIDLQNLDAKAESLARLCEAQDVANAVLFLASDESRFINGVELRVDNGFLVSGDA